MTYVIYTDFGIYDDTLGVPVSTISDPSFDGGDIVWRGSSYLEYIRYGFAKVEDFPFDRAATVLEDENED
jgi:hypothetical protein